MIIYSDILGDEVDEQCPIQTPTEDQDRLPHRTYQVPAVSVLPGWCKPGDHERVAQRDGWDDFEEKNESGSSGTNAGRKAMNVKAMRGPTIIAPPATPNQAQSYLRSHSKIHTCISSEITAQKRRSGPLRWFGDDSGGSADGGGIGNGHDEDMVGALSG